MAGSLILNTLNRHHAKTQSPQGDYDGRQIKSDLRRQRECFQYGHFIIRGCLTSRPHAHLSQAGYQVFLRTVALDAMVRSAKLVTMSPNVAVWHDDDYARKRGGALMLMRTHFGRWYRQKQDLRDFMIGPDWENSITEWSQS